MALVALGILIAIFEFWDRVIRRHFDKFGSRVIKAIRPDELVAISGYRRTFRRLPKRNKIYFFVFFSYIFGSSLSIVPTFSEQAKFFQSSTTKDLLGELEKNWNAIPFGEAIASDGFWIDYLFALSLFMPLFLLFIYLLDVRVRRRKIIRAFVQLEGHLLYANIFDGALKNSIGRANNVLSREARRDINSEQTSEEKATTVFRLADDISQIHSAACTRFDDAIAIVRLQRSIEENKQTGVKLSLAFLALICLGTYAFLRYNFSSFVF